MFEAFPKMGRLFRDIVITEKLDGTNAQIYINAVNVVEFYEGYEDAQNTIIAEVDGVGIWAGSRNKFITPGDDNYGFAKFVKDNAPELIKGLGIGRHFGEWWGKGIQRGYGLDTKKFSLFNTTRWKTVASDAPDRETLPACCSLVPELYRGPFSQEAIDRMLEGLSKYGSRAAPGFMDPEGIITFHTAANVGFKTTIKNDGVPKGQVK